MYLREVTINGFKSFADITRLELQPGVTAIVGPNGCGKSNIADAVRWVLGEQSAKSLRGGSMQDIIFGGSEKRKALPFSEVSLVFSDCEVELGASFHEVEVSRRVSRDGSSQYRINGKISRLKDLQRLFMDTGVGQVAYSFLVQGQVDQILSTNPADRRTIFEEAAGITRYKSQRKETLNKLALVDANLSRVSDVIEEVSRQIGSLKRQASKAVRFKRLSHRQRNLENALHAFRIKELDASIAELEAATASIKGETESLRKEIDKREASLSGDRERRTRIYERIEETQERLFEHRSAREAAENRIEALETRRRDHEVRIGKLETEIGRMRNQRSELDARGAEENQTLQQQLHLVGDSDAETEQKRKAFEEASRALDERERAFRAHRETLGGAENTIARLRSRCTSLEVNLKSYEVRHAAHGETVHTARQEAETLAGKEEATTKALVQRRAEADESAEQLRKKREELEAIRTGFRTAQTEVQEIDRQLARTTARRQVLQDLQDRMEGHGEGAKALRKGKLGEPFSADRFTLLSSLIEVAPEHAAAAEALLGPAVDAVLWTDEEDLPSLIEAMRGKGVPRTALLAPAPETAPDSPALPGLTPAGDVVRPKDDRIAALLPALLADCHFAESDTALFAWRRENPGARFHRVVTGEGTVFSGDGMVVAGKAHDGKQSLLGREAEIRRIQEEITAREKELDAKRETIQTTQEQIDRIEREVEEIRERATEIQSEKTTLEAEEKALRTAREENRRTLAEAEEKMRTLEESRSASENDLTQARTELDKAEQDLKDGRAAVAEHEAAIDALRTTRDERKEEWTNTRLDHASRKQALELVEKGLSEIERRKKEIDLICKTRSEEIAQLRSEIEEAATDKEREKETVEESTGNLETAKSEMEEERTRLRTLEESLSERERETAEMRKTLQEKEQSFNRKEVELTRQRSKAEFILEKSSTENEVDIRQIDWRRALWDADRDFKSRVRLDDMEEGDDLDLDPVDQRGDPTEENLDSYQSADWEEIEDECRKLREKIQSLGAVNLVAIEEYKDLKERYEFLQSQSQDLWNSKEELLRAIDEINETSQTLFQETFEKIRENFRYTYDHLTNGGSADLELIEAEDVLDSGIEIKARPPGVRTSTLSLLSGGQRTMAAVALLFAIYMVKPSPFCVLDELDAPLDDANIGRFTEMLKRFTEYSQFLIITHNKRTIAASDSVFGVTMQEKGVSRLVSMRFNHNTQKAEFAEGELEGKAIATE